jgi:hypothetical protein
MIGDAQSKADPENLGTTFGILLPIPSNASWPRGRPFAEDSPKSWLVALHARPGLTVMRYMASRSCKRSGMVPRARSIVPLQPKTLQALARRWQRVCRKPHVPSAVSRRRRGRHQGRRGHRDRDEGKEGSRRKRHARHSRGYRGRHRSRRRRGAGPRQAAVRPAAAWAACTKRLSSRTRSRSLRTA